MFDFTLSPESPKTEASGGLYDVVIVGGGPAGLTTAIYTSRDGMKTLVLEREGTGGLAATTEMIENYPGFPDGVNGMALMDDFRQQAERFGTEIVEFDAVVKVDPVAKGKFEVHTEGGQVFTGKTVVVATGSQPKKLDIPGENEFYGRGVSYCATCDGPFFRDKERHHHRCGQLWPAGRFTGPRLRQTRDVPRIPAIFARGANPPGSRQESRQQHDALQPAGDRRSG